MPSFFENLMARVRTAAGQANDWPPSKELKDRWDEIEYYRLKVQNDPNFLIPYNSAYSAASFQKREQFTPVPVARQLTRFSAGMLFSEPAKITLPPEPRRSPDEPSSLDAKDKPTTHPLQDSLDDLLEKNGMEAFLQECGQNVAVEGRGAFRIIWDQNLSKENPLITYIPEDQMIWDIRHGRFVVGGICVLTIEEERGSAVYRMLESHEPGRVSRQVYKGTTSSLGRKLTWGSNEVPLKWRDDGLLEEEPTKLDVPTIVKWDNVEGGASDLLGVEILLNRLDEGESLLLEKVRKSRPWLFTDREFADSQGRVDISGLILLNSSEEYLPDEKKASRLVEHIQPSIQATDHITYLDHLRESILYGSGYALASWGLEQGGPNADSGIALKVRQALSLLTRASKERYAREAITTAVAVAMALKHKRNSIEEFKPEIAFGDGLPDDRVELAQAILTLRQAHIISTEQGVRMLHPDWTDAAVIAEAERIEAMTPIAGGARTAGDGANAGSGQGKGSGGGKPGRDADSDGQTAEEEEQEKKDEAERLAEEERKRRRARGRRRNEGKTGG